MKHEKKYVFGTFLALISIYLGLASLYPDLKPSFADRRLPVEDILRRVKAPPRVPVHGLDKTVVLRVPRVGMFVKTLYSHYPVSRTGTAYSVEYPSTGGLATVTLYLLNDGTADLTRGKLHIAYESGYDVKSDQSFTKESYPVESGVRGIIMDVA